MFATERWKCRRAGMTPKYLADPFAESKKLSRRQISDKSLGNMERPNFQVNATLIDPDRRGQHEYDEAADSKSARSPNYSCPRHSESVFSRKPSLLRTSTCWDNQTRDQNNSAAREQRQGNKRFCITHHRGNRFGYLTVAAKCRRLVQCSERHRRRRRVTYRGRLTYSNRHENSPQKTPR